MWTVKIFNNRGELLSSNQYPTEDAAAQASSGVLLEMPAYGGQVLVLDPTGEVCH